MEPNQWANRLGEKEGQKAKEYVHMGFGVVRKCHQTGDWRQRLR